MARLLHYASQAGLLKEVSSTEYVVLPYLDIDITEKDFTQHDKILVDDWAFAKFYISKLEKFLRGSESILPHLFPPSLLELPSRVDNQTGETDNFSAERFYGTTVQSAILTDNLIGVFASLIRDGVKGLRILEVGAGTGSATRKLLQHLQGTSSTYTFTDISTNFLNRAEDSLPHVPGVQIDFRILDLEKDIVAQGFEKGTFDMIVAVNVLHATTDLGKVVGNLNMLLGPDGNIFVAEQLRPSAISDVIFGHCKGYWLCNDDIRSAHSLIDGEAWKLVLQSAGYGDVSIVENKYFDVGIIVATKEDVPLPFHIIVTRGDDEFANQLKASNGNATFCNINDKEFIIQPNARIVYCFPHTHDDCALQEDQARIQLNHFLDFARVLLLVGKAELFLLSHGLMPVQDEESP